VQTCALPISAGVSNLDSRTQVSTAGMVMPPTLVVIRPRPGFGPSSRLATLGAPFAALGLPSADVSPPSCPQAASATAARPEIRIILVRMASSLVKPSTIRRGRDNAPGRGNRGGAAAVRTEAKERRHARQIRRPAKGRRRRPVGQARRYAEVEAERRVEIDGRVDERERAR